MSVYGWFNLFVLNYSFRAFSVVCDGFCVPSKFSHLMVFISYSISPIIGNSFLYGYCFLGFISIVLVHQWCEVGSAYQQVCSFLDLVFSIHLHHGQAFTSLHAFSVSDLQCYMMLVVF